MRSTTIFMPKSPAFRVLTQLNLYFIIIQFARSQVDGSADMEEARECAAISAAYHAQAAAQNQKAATAALAASKQHQQFRANIGVSCAYAYIMLICTYFLVMPASEPLTDTVLALFGISLLVAVFVHTESSARAPNLKHRSGEPARSQQ